MVPVGTRGQQALAEQPVVTFDFHNTIARCDRWFTLEIRELVPAFLTWSADRHGLAPPSADQLDAARVAYHEFRTEIGRSGIEQDAVACLVALLPALGRDVRDDEIREGVDRLMAETFDDDVQPLPGVVETVRFLADRGVRLGVISSAVYTPFLHWTLGRFALAGDFPMVLTSADAGFYKSHPGIYVLAAERLGAAPGGIVHVGDSFRFDVQGARRAGFQTVWVQGDRPTPAEPAAELTLPDLVGAGPALLALAEATVGRDRSNDGR